MLSYDVHYGESAYLIVLGTNKLSLWPTELQNHRLRWCITYHNTLATITVVAVKPTESAVADTESPFHPLVKDCMIDCIEGRGDIQENQDHPEAFIHFSHNIIMYPHEGCLCAMPNSICRLMWFMHVFLTHVPIQLANRTFFYNLGKERYVRYWSVILKQVTFQIWLFDVWFDNCLL